MAKMGIQVRLLIVVMVCSFVIVATIVSYAFSNYRTNLYSAQQEKIESIIRTIDVQVNTEQDLKDMDKYRRLFSYLMEYDNQLLQINLFAPIHGKYYVLASNDTRQIGKTVSPGELEVIRSGKTHSVEQQPGKVMEITAPIHVGDNPMAAMSFYLDISQQTSLLQQEVTRMLLLGGVGTGLMMGLLYLFINSLILKPLGQLGEITRRVAKGDLSYRVEIADRAELSQLGHSFNQMADQLLQRYQQGVIDEPTGLPNYFFFKDRLAEELQKAKLEETSLAVLLLDFGKISRWAGLIGENAVQVVREAARTVNEMLPEEYSCARYSSRELMVIAPGLDEQGALAMAVKLADAVGRKLEGEETRLTGGYSGVNGLKVGIAVSPGDGQEGEGLMIKGELALEAAGTTFGRSAILFRELVEGVGSFAPGVYEAYRQKGQLEILQALNGLFEGKGVLGRSHSAGVAKYAAGLGLGMGLSPTEVDYLITAALLHELGQVCSSEVKSNQSHQGAALVERVGAPARVIEILRCQDEHYDGSGVPRGLKGEEIPLEARILAVAHRFDTLLGESVMLTPQRIEDCITELWARSGTILDPKLTEKFIALQETENGQITEVSA
ncbi:MAG: HAMP domain-containing protein [Clostridia bacterium]|nr:HAMP domain-containing protein [Clostridia bacterium]